MVASSQLMVANCQLLVVGCQLPVDGCQFPVASSQLRVSELEVLAEGWMLADALAGERDKSDTRDKGMRPVKPPHSHNNTTSENPQPSTINWQLATNNQQLATSN